MKSKTVKLTSFLLLATLSSLMLLSSCSSLNDSCGCFRASSKNLEAEKRAFSVAWAKNNDPEYNSGNLPISYNYPLVHDGIVYVGHNSGYMVAYELQTGREIWKERDGGEYRAAPTVLNDTIIYGTTLGRVFARNALTGKLKYSIHLDDSIESEGVINKGMLVFHLRNHKIVCLDAKTGKIIWTNRRSVPYTITLQRVSTPLFVGNKLIVGFADGHVVAFSAFDGAVLWENKLSQGSKFVDIDTTPVFHNNKIYITSVGGPLVILNANNGNVLRREQFYSARAPIVTKDKIILGTTGGEVVVLNNRFEVVMRKLLSKEGISSIVDWKNYLVVATIDGSVHFLNPGDLKELDEFQLGHPSSVVYGKLRVADNKLAVHTSRNRLYLLK